MSNDRELIRGKVARILTARQLALNIGVKDGVKVGMLFDVLDPKGDDITDPDTGEVLGSLYRPKVRAAKRNRRFSFLIIGIFLYLFIVQLQPHS